MSETICSCGQPTGDTAAMCNTCRHVLEQTAANIAAYHADLDTLRTRQTRYTTSGGGRRSAEQPAGMDLRFARLGVGSELEHDTRNTVTTWARIILEHVSVGHGPVCARTCLHVSCARVRRSRPPADTVASCCAYLATWSDWLRTSPAGLEALDELLDLERRLQRLVDRPADRWYAGKCGAQIMTAGPPEATGVCTAELYATVESGDLPCPACGTVYSIAARREYLLGEAEQQIATATTIARAVAVWSDYGGGRDENRLVDLIRKWGERNRIVPMAHEVIDGRRRALYRVGDVLDRLADNARRHAVRKPTSRQDDIAC